MKVSGMKFFSTGVKMQSLLLHYFSRKSFQKEKKNEGSFNLAKFIEDCCINLHQVYSSFILICLVYSNVANSHNLFKALKYWDMFLAITRWESQPLNVSFYLFCLRGKVKIWGCITKAEKLKKTEISQNTIFLKTLKKSCFKAQNQKEFKIRWCFLKVRGSKYGISDFLFSTNVAFLP